MAQGRAIMGLSMGGHGALFLALRHQELLDGLEVWASVDFLRSPIIGIYLFC